MVAMANHSNSSTDVFLDGGFSPHLQELYSPLSNYTNISHELSNSSYLPEVMPSGYAQEVNFNFTGDEYEDYSQIQYPTRRGRSTLPPPDPPLRTSSVTSFSSDYSHRSYPTNHRQQYYSPHDYRNHNYQPNYQQSRRRTWSPSQIKASMTGGLNQSNKGYNTIDQVDNDSLSHVTSSTENSDSGPPRLAPVSGMLTKSPAKGIIRPIAFKPVILSNQNYVNTRHFTDRKYSHQDDGYGSQDYPIANRSAGDTSHSSIQMESDRSTSFSSDSQKPYTPERPESIPSSNVSHASSVRMEGYTQTPSPSDSGVGELEAMLKEKDAEINTLREVMDKNERAIFQVYEEKSNSWSREMKDLRDECDRKIKLQQRKSYKTEQTLSLQIYKLQQEKKSLREELEKSKTECVDLKCKCDTYASENDRLQSQLADVSFTGSQGTEDITYLQQQVELLNQSLSEKTRENLMLFSQIDKQKSQLLEKEEDINQRFKDVVSKTEEVKSLRAKLLQFANNNDMDVSDSSCNHSEQDMDQSKLSTPVSDLDKSYTKRTSLSDQGRPSNSRNSQSGSPLYQSKVKSPVNDLFNCSASSDKDTALLELQEEAKHLKDELMDKNEIFEKEKEQWLDEKNKVIRYQKQLQLNYVQMYNKNKVLEAEVEQLTLELERRDLKLMSINGSEESVC